MSDIQQPSGEDSVPGKSRTLARLSDWIAERFKALFCVGVITSAISVAARWHWISDLLANLRVQQVIGLAFVLLVFILLRRWHWAIATGLLVLFHVPWFLQAIEPIRRHGEVELSVMVANVLTENPHHDRIVSQIQSQDPDVLAILELGTPLHLKLEAELATRYPYRIALPQDLGNFGIGIYSKLPFVGQETFTLNIDSIPSIAVTVEQAGELYHVIATHPLPPLGARGFRDRNAHLSQLAERIAGYRNEHPHRGLIVVGDLNLTPWSPLMTDLEQTTDLRRAGRGFGITPTWYFRPFFPFGLMLDHGLISSELTCVEHVVCDDNGSDHRAVHLQLARLR